jgi:hypothetical protein
MGPTKLETLNLKTLDSGLFFFFIIIIISFFFSSLGSCYQNTIPNTPLLEDDFQRR